MASPNAVIAEILRMLRRFMMFSFGLEMDYKHDSDGRLMDGLLVIADAAAQVGHPGHEAHFRYRRCGCARLRKHVADLGELTFRLLRCRVQFLTELLAGRVLERSCVCASGDKNRTSEVLAVPGSATEYIEVTVPEPTLSLVEHPER